MQGNATPLSLRTFTEPVRDIPQTIEVIPSEVIQAQGATTLRDVLRNVPGITLPGGRRGRRPARRQLIHPRLQRAATTSSSTASAIRRLLARRLQPRTGRGHQGAVVGHRRPRRDGRRDQPGHQVAAARDRLQRHARRAATRRTSAAPRDINVPLERLGKGVAFRVNAMWTEGGVPGRDVVENSGWGVAPSHCLRPGHADHASGSSYQHLDQDNVPDYGLPWGASPDFPTGAFNAHAAGRSEQLLRLGDYDFETINSDVGTAEIDHRFANRADAAQPDAVRRDDRDSAITAPRPPNRHGSTASCQTRDMSDENLANQTNLTARSTPGRMTHDVVAGHRGRPRDDGQPQLGTGADPAADRHHQSRPQRSAARARCRRTGQHRRARLDLAGDLRLRYREAERALAGHGRTAAGRRGRRLLADEPRGRRRHASSTPPTAW